MAVDTPEPSAFAGGILSSQPYTFLDDAPLEVATAGGLYRPRNYDETFRGLTARYRQLKEMRHAEHCRLKMAGPGVVRDSLHRNSLPDDFQRQLPIKLLRDEVLVDPEALSRKAFIFTYSG